MPKENGKIPVSITDNKYFTIGVANDNEMHTLIEYKNYEDCEREALKHAMEEQLDQVMDKVNDHFSDTLIQDMVKHRQAIIEALSESSYSIDVYKNNGQPVKKK